MESILDVLHKARDFVSESKLEEALNCISSFCSEGLRLDDYLQLKQRNSKQERSESSGTESHESLRRSRNDISDAIIALLNLVEKEEQKNHDEKKNTHEKEFRDPSEVMDVLIRGTDRSIKWYQNVIYGLILSNFIVLSGLIYSRYDSLMTIIATLSYFGCTSFGIITAFINIRGLKEKNNIYNTLSRHPNKEYIFSTIEKHIEAVLS